MSEYYHNLVTKKSFEILKQLQRTHNFILIGGWAVFVWTKSLKSKDIDIVLDYLELEKFKGQYELTKNDRLKKYEAKEGEVDIDIYVNNYSNPGLPAEEIEKYAVPRAGFRVPRPEVLLMLKQVAHEARSGTPKGAKDAIDIVSLLADGEIDFAFYNQLLDIYKKSGLKEKLKALLKSMNQVPERNLNQHALSRLRSRVMEQLGL
ncbi:MAG: hypothetical protein A3H70_02455 [Candidatus Komeilibacteria bacterium RIFCSPLOWO2_02_FULL_48_11]|uniref:Nucleotidyl transferase AbiEii/AbiGii toxin family protein n=1 Tax=Candidatus Komeilibacteria bacterium RIFCSPLOWO2_02_FULL_48_11 TaxID=1798553 RepID=A0A1G2BXN4_9BACT|nr:MAG: hypothetical protein A3H70_02455 [Candidatus Komeilibacteria bacterium RIFCSPLOWO2_02_FULL_48_11]